MRWFSLLATWLLLPGVAAAQPPDATSPLAGVWAPGDLLAALQADAPRAIGCYLVVETEPLEIFEDCGGGRSRWTGAVVEAPRAGRVEIRVGERRQVIFRAGAPNELELVRTEPGQQPQLERLYRLPALVEDRLRSWAASQHLLVGRWRTEEGAEATFLPDGTYRIANEGGTYRLQPGAPLRGSWGVLQLHPDDDGRRLYLLTGAGRRVGLALPPDHLVEALRGEAAAPAAQQGEQERGVSPDELGDEEEDEGEYVPPQEEEEAPLQAAAPAPPQQQAPPLPAAAELEVAMWLERIAEPQAAVPEPEVAPVEAAPPPPIAQPIERQRRGTCGCAAGEGAVGLGAAVVSLLALRRRRRHDPGT